MATICESVIIMNLEVTIFTIIEDLMQIRWDLENGIKKDERVLLTPKQMQVILDLLKYLEVDIM